MSINFKQSQFELFPGSPGQPSDPDKKRFYLTNLSISLDNIIVMGIVSLMILILSFSLGVEKGKVKDQISQDEKMDTSVES